jgi:DNA-binding NarL/FixJ family response regulator
MTRVLLAEDEAILRDLLSTVIDTASDFEVVAEVADGMAAVAQANETLPDIAVVDWFLPLLHGYDASRLMLAAHPELRILMMSAVGDDRFVVRSLRAGVRGYFLKSEERPDRLLTALRAIAASAIYLSPGIARLLPIVNRRDLVRDEPLPPRQRQVLQLRAEGASIKEISGSCRFPRRPSSTIYRL